MLDIGWTELLVIGVVALIVVGPKDLPVMFRQLGRFTGRLKAMAREFTSAMNEAADQSGMSDLQKDLAALKDPRKLGLDALNDAVDEADKWTPPSMTKPDTTKPAAPNPASEAAQPASQSEPAETKKDQA
ncbi:MAG: Sec-independent protein translocase protein TatB [Mangrovicoccus sp.]